MPDPAITIEKYDPNWPTMFEEEQRLLSAVLSPWLKGTIEHVGSTAVPDLKAKPIIDIMVGVQSLNVSADAIPVLNTNGYCYYPYKKEVMHWFCKPSPEIRTHHLHLVPFGSQLWQERISFRDILRNNPSVREEYAQLKCELAKRYKKDREQYTQKKWPFIQRVLQDAALD